MSLSIINEIFTKYDIEYILSLQEVINAKKNIDTKNSGSVYFSITLTQSIKDKIYEKFGLTLDTVPMRWIKGDTMPHIDRGSKQFERTHLVYLTDSLGKFLIEDNEYPIIKGNAFVFNEGLRHETINTGLEPRLLLGPMSEQGLSVGAATTISAPGGTTAYIRDDNVFGLQYSTDNKATWNPISLPISVENTTLNGMLTIEFINDITIMSEIFYFQCITNNIQFGSRTLNNDGTRRKITITGLAPSYPYPGLIKNFDGSTGYSSIYIFNLEVLSSGSTLADDAGWLCQTEFGNSATNNYIINCHSNGNITGTGSGGLVGSYSANNGQATLTIIGCSSSGEILGSEAGGIIGYNSGASTTGILTIESCWSSGNIGDGSLGSGFKSGGIIGSFGGYSGNLHIKNCYFTGVINGDNSGGISGFNTGDSGNFLIENCYSTGLINGIGSGGICGYCEPFGTLTGTIQNCYASGNVVNNDAGAICGEQSTSSGGTNTITIIKCYTSGTVSSLSGNGYIIAGVTTIPTGCFSEAANFAPNPSEGWKNENANNTLIGTPGNPYSSSLSVWQTIFFNAPYELFNMGYTPYSTTNISGNNLIRTSSATINQGNSTSQAIKTFGIFYTFLEDYITPFQINIDNATGVISTTSATPIGTYTLYIYNTGSYNITTYTLTVTNAPPTPTNNIKTELPVQRVSLNQKSSFCGTRAVSATAVGIGAIRGKGSATRIFNNCKGNNTINFKLCQFRVLGFK